MACRPRTVTRGMQRKEGLADSGMARAGHERTGLLRADMAIEVRSREDLAVMLVENYRVLRELARRYLPAMTDYQVEATVDRAIKVMLKAKNPSHADGLKYAAGAIYRECQRTKRLANEPDPYDSVLNKRLSEVVEYLELLGPRYRRTLLQAFMGRRPAEIAREEGISLARVNQRLHHSRRRIQKLLEEKGQAAMSLLALAPRRLAHWLGRGVGLIADVSRPQPFAASTLVPLVAWTLFSTGTTPAPVATNTTHGRAMPALIGGDGYIWRPPDRAGAPSVTTVASWRVEPGGTGAPPAAGVPGHTAATETPDDVTLSAVATPADGRPVIVAVGTGGTCICPVVMRSLDGGATWDLGDGPPADANQLAIPPTYPNDPRIFAGVDPKLGGAPYESGGFRQKFSPLTTLPAGKVAVSSAFDAGDPRVFVAGQTAVWSLDVDNPTALPHDEVDYAAAGGGTSTTVAALATPRPSASSPAVVAWVPALATIPGATSTPSAESVVVRCPVASSCVPGSALPPVLPGHLAVGPGELVAYWNTAAYLSRDGGTSFAPLPLPATVAQVNSLAVAGRDGEGWISFRRGDGLIDVARLLPKGTWVDAAGDSQRVHANLGVLIPVGGDRIIEEFRSLGYRCTTTAGGPWMARCPAT